MWCSAGPSVCVCVIRGMPSSCRSAGESECVCWAGPSVCVCVSYEECRVAVGLLERVSVSCWAGPSVCACVVRGMLFSCQSPGESECVVLGRSVCVCVCLCVCVYVIRGMPSSYPSAVESECVCWAGPSVCACVIQGMLSVSWRE